MVGTPGGKRTPKLGPRNTTEMRFQPTNRRRNRPGSPSPSRSRYSKVKSDLNRIQSKIAIGVGSRDRTPSTKTASGNRSRTGNRKGHTKPVPILAPTQVSPRRRSQIVLKRTTTPPNPNKLDEHKDQAITHRKTVEANKEAAAAAAASAQAKQEWLAAKRAKATKRQEERKAAKRKEQEELDAKEEAKEKAKEARRQYTIRLRSMLKMQAQRDAHAQAVASRKEWAENYRRDEAEKMRTQKLLQREQNKKLKLKRQQTMKKYESMISVSGVVTESGNGGGDGQDGSSAHSSPTTKEEAKVGGTGTATEIVQPQAESDSAEYSKICGLKPIRTTKVQDDDNEIADQPADDMNNNVNNDKSVDGSTPDDENESVAEHHRNQAWTYSRNMASTHVRDPRASPKRWPIMP